MQHYSAMKAKRLWGMLAEILDADDVFKGNHTQIVKKIITDPQNLWNLTWL